MLSRLIACAVVLALTATNTALEVVEKGSSEHHRHHHKGHGKHHHHKGHHHHKKDHKDSLAKVESTAAPSKQADTKSVAKPTAAKAGAVKLVAAVKETKDEQLVDKMKALEVRLSQEKKKRSEEAKGHLLVSGPVPADFSERFSQAVAAATGVDAKKVSVTSTKPEADQPDVIAVDFKAPAQVVAAVESQAGDSDSKLARGNMHSFLVDKDDEDEAAKKQDAKAEPKHEAAGSQIEATPVETKGIDIDTAMPYGDLEPFGREDTAQELTEDSVKESDSMVDQLERAEVAEEKRSVFRALTRLRGAAITSFDGVARSQTGNIDEYNKIHQWRTAHPLHHLADEESDISKWAFPDNADF